MARMKTGAKTNPFLPAVIARGAHFADREAEVARLVRSYQSPGSRLVVYGERRMGKSSALDRAAEVARRGGCAVALASFATATDPADAAKSVLLAVREQLGRNWREALESILGRLQGSVVIRPSAAGLPPSLHLTLGLGDEHPHSRMIPEALDSIHAELESRKLTLALGIDEFQRLHEWGGEEAEWGLKAAIEKHPRIAYVLAGSQKSLIEAMISGQGRALWKQTEVLPFGRIPAEEMAGWIQSQAARTGAEFSLDACDRIVEIAGPRTRDIVLLAREVWFEAPELITARDPAPSPSLPAEVSMAGNVDGVGTATSSGIPMSADRGMGRWLDSLDTWVADASGLLSRWDLPLLVLWAVLTAFLAGIVGHASLEGLRLRSGLHEGEVDGTPVLLSDAVGPAAIGVGTRSILMPRWTLDLDLTLRTMLLRHEREHLEARDPLLLLLALLAAVLVPWNLPLWWARKRMLLAVEVDCDRRVLKAHPDVRRYGQLLLLAAQRVPASAWAGLAILTVVAPLQPRTSHLARRISAMTQPHDSRFTLRSLGTIISVGVLGGLLAVLPAPKRAAAQAPAQSSASASSTAEASGSHDSEAQEAGARAHSVPPRIIVDITSVRLTMPSNDPISILIYTSGGGRVGIGDAAPTAIADTIRLDHLPAMTADVTDGDVQIEISSPGSIRVGGTVTGGPARTVSASGRHIILAKGGTGIAWRM